MAQLNIRLTEAQHVAFKEEARRLRLSLNTWVLRRLERGGTPLDPGEQLAYGAALGGLPLAAKERLVDGSWVADDEEPVRPDLTVDREEEP